jgi:hypothetical protein
MLPDAATKLQAQAPREKETSPFQTCSTATAEGSFPKIVGRVYNSRGLEIRVRFSSTKIAFDV